MGINLLSYQASLKIELAKYSAQGKKDKAADVVKELARLDDLLSTGQKSPAESVTPSIEEEKTAPKRILKKSKGN